MPLDSKTIIKAGAIATALVALGGAGAVGLKTAVTYVGGDGPPYASRAEEAKFAEQVKTLKQSQPVILWHILQSDADNCDNRTTVLNIQAKATRNSDLQAEASKNDHRCGKLHDQADEAGRALLPH